MKKFNVLFAFCAAFLILTIGCGREKPVEIVRQCPGKKSVHQALDAMSSSADKLQSFLAYGEGRVTFYEEGKDEPRNEKIPTVKLWFAPPGNMRFWGDVAFNPRGLDVGSNEREFWLAAKPKEIGNIYIWGQWDEQTDEMGLLFSPKILLAALGVIDTDALWAFTPGKSSDILLLYDENGRVQRKVVIDNCDYRISGIDFYDNRGVLAIKLELGDYRQIGEMVVPGEIRIINLNSDGSEDTFEIRLKSIKLDDKIKAAVFERPDTKGFGEIHQIIGGRVIKLEQ